MTILKTTELYFFKWVNFMACELNKAVKKHIMNKKQAVVHFHTCLLTGRKGLS